MNQNDVARRIALGYRFLAALLKPSEELMHYGVKGMKWGVRNGPPYPIDRERVATRTKGDKIVMDALASGAVKDGINQEKQQRHLKGQATGNRSYLDCTAEEAERLYNELKGTGEAMTNDITGEWLHKERVVADHICGVLVDSKTGQSTQTDKLMIVYSKTGSHVYPRKEISND